MIPALWLTPEEEEEADDCIVVLLDHSDATPPTNEAPYAITHWTSAYYETDTTTKKFGAGSFSAKSTIGSSHDSTRITFDSPGVPLNNGALTIEFWLLRTGGTGALSSGNQWSAPTYLEFDNSGWIQFTPLNYFRSSDSTYHRGMLIEMDNGDGDYDEYYAIDFDFLPDSDFHAIAFSMAGDGTWTMLVDGVTLASGTLASIFPAGINLTFLAYEELRGGMKQDETRITLGMARYPTDYTPNNGPWDDATCDSGFTPEVTERFLDFQGALVGAGPNAITTFYDTSPQDFNIVFSEESGVIDVGGLPAPVSSTPSGSTVLYQNGTGTVQFDFTSGGFVDPVTFYLYHQTGTGNLRIQLYDSVGTQLYDAGQTNSTWALNTINFSGVATRMVFVGNTAAYLVDGITLQTVV